MTGLELARRFAFDSPVRYVAPARSPCILPDFVLDFGVMIFQASYTSVRLAIKAGYVLLRVSIASVCLAGAMVTHGSQLHGLVRTPYFYPPIESPRGIRLLIVRKWTSFISIHCDILEVPLNEAPPFEAISYTWGNEEPTAQIIVGGDALLNITPAVFDFLACHLSIFNKRTFWIDAVCINQDDNLEKNKQVILMKDIYQRASRVIVWLGPSTEATDSDLANRALAYLAASEEEFRASPNTSITSTVQASIERGPEFYALAKLFEHPWFSRVWVIQEVALAGSVVVEYGDMSIEWDQLIARVAMITDPQLGVFKILGVDGKHEGSAQCAYRRSGSLANALVMAICRDTIQSNERLSMGAAIDWSAGFEATNPRDRVFGLLGIIKDSNHEELAPDYDASLSEVLRKATRYLVSNYDPETESHSFEHAGIGYEISRELEDHPSWAINFTKGLAQRMDRTLGSKPEIIFLDDSKTIKVKAFHIDTLCSVSRPWNSPTEGANLAQCGEGEAANYSHFKAFIESNNRGFYPNKEALDDGFWNVLMMSEASDKNYSTLSPSEYLKRLETRFQVTQKLLGSSLGEGEEREALEKRFLEGEAFMTPIAIRFEGSCLRRRFCITEEGRLGLVPPLSKEGDVICFFEGLPMPFVLRQEEGREQGMEQYYQLVGRCYIHGLIGEGVKKVDPKDWFTLV